MSTKVYRKRTYESAQKKFTFQCDIQKMARIESGNEITDVLH